MYGTPIRGTPIRGPVQRDQESLQLGPQSREARLPGAGLQMHHDVARGEILPALEAAKDLAHPPLDAVTDHRVADLAAGGDAETGLALVVRVEVEGGQGAATFSALPVAAQEVGPAPQPVVAAQLLA